MKGTKFGPMVVPGKPDLSNLMVLIKGQGQIRMPKGHKPLPEELVDNIWKWIFEGAKNIPRLNRNPAEEASQNREFGFDWGDDSSEFSFS